MIAEKLSRKNILITGATGFLGKVILEKLLRSVPDVGTIYLLIRPKKNRSSDDRLNVLISSRIFNRMRSYRKDFEEFAKAHLRVVPGDVESEQCGMSEEDLLHVQQNVHIFIHSAATINFTAPLSESVNLNVLGSLRLFAIAKKCVHIEAFTHISTAYVNCNKVGLIEEQLYPLDFDPEEVYQTLLKMDPAELDAKETQIIQGFPNTYTFTKSLTEHLLAEHRENIPLLIFRPSIIGAAYKEPTPGWLDTVSAASALYVTAGMGIMKFMMVGRPDQIGDQVPADIVSNALIAGTADIACENRMNIMQAGTSRDKPLTWRYVKKIILPYLLKRPPKRTFSKPNFMFVTSDAVYNSLYFFQYRVPIAAYNLYARFLGNDEQLREAQLWASFEKRIRKMVGNFNYFINNEWIFDTAHTYAVFNKLSEDEKEEFNFDIAKIDWEEYLLAFCYGMKLNILREENTIYPPEDRNCPMYLRRDLGSDFWWAYSGGEGINDMYKTNPPEKIKSTVLHSARVQDAIAKESQKEEIPIKQLEEHAREMIDTMAGTVNMGVLRTQGYFWRKFYRYFYNGIFVDEWGIKRVAEAAKRGPIILVPTHRSYVDFLLLSFVFYDHDLPVPRIAAGDDFLNMMLVSWIFRNSGAFFMRRTFGSDDLYRSIFTEYVQQTISCGHPLEFFVEGTRSRTGKSLPPKLGVLSIIVDAIMEGGLDNVSICPITISYERMIEEESHGRELSGEPKEKPTTTALVKATVSKLMHMDFGRINVQFAEPIDVESYIQNVKEERVSSGSAEFDPYNSKSDLWTSINSLGHEIIESFHREAVVMHTSIVSAILLVHRDGISVDMLVDSMGWLVDQIQKRGYRVDPYEGTSAEILDHCLPLLEELVVIKRNIVELKTGTKAESVFHRVLQLSMYRNCIAHIFQREGILAVSLLSFGEEVVRSSGVPVQELRVRHDFLSNMFENEFVDRYRSRDFAETLQKMVDANLLRVSGELVSLVSSESHHEDMLNFLCEMVWPYVEAYWMAVQTLRSLQGKHTGLIERILVERMQWFAEKCFNANESKYQEACSKDALRNAIKHFCQEGVLEQNESTTLTLNAPYKDSPQSLQELIDTVSLYRGSKSTHPTSIMARM